MPLRVIVLVKQVPDTKNVTGEVMKPDGTVNRGALAAIFNPEDVNALEMGLELKERYGGEVIVITMGPPRAAEILKDSLCRGADRVILLSDRRFAASDTLATSYTIAQAITTHLMPYDVVLCGRQAIDGDTAQVGPQVAEKLGIAQVTYASQVLEFDGARFRIRRDLGRAHEVVETVTPVLMTVPKTANLPRWPNARLLLKYRRARSAFEVEAEAKAQGRSVDEVVAGLRSRGLFIETWGAEDIGADLARIGISGSPTKVKKIENVVLAGLNLKMFRGDDDGVRALVNELVEERTFG
ncbi:MAG: electron transfer flavoprotein subunit beta/FixA family protein [Bryobacteraceae bacterium]